MATHYLRCVRDLQRDLAHERCIVPAHINPALPLTTRLPAFLHARLVRADAAAINRGATTWPAHSAAVVALNLTNPSN